MHLAGERYDGAWDSLGSSTSMRKADPFFMFNVYGYASCLKSLCTSEKNQRDGCNFMST